MPPVPQRHCGLTDSHARHDYFTATVSRLVDGDPVDTIEAVFDANPGGGTRYRCTGNPAHYNPADWPVQVT